MKIFKHTIFAMVFVLMSVVLYESYAQDADSSATQIDCSIPIEAQTVKPGKPDEKVLVKVGFFVIDVKEIDDLKQTFTADVWFTKTWNDPRLSEQALGKSLENCIYRLSDIWNPHVIVINQYGGDTLLEKVARIDPLGNVTVRQRYVGDITSDLDFSNFPFDYQQLHFIVAAVGPDSQSIAFEVYDDTTGQREPFSVEGWRVKLIGGNINNEQIKSLDNKPILNLHRLDFTLEAERDKGYYLWKVIAPLCLIVLMAWAVFWIDPKNLGPQVGLSTATVFTLIAYRFSIGFSLPKVSYFTRMDNFVLFSTILVFIALGTAIATSKISSDMGNSLAKKIEKYMRVVYPLIFLAIMLFTLWL